MRILLATDWMSPPAASRPHPADVRGARCGRGRGFDPASRGASPTGGGADYVAYGSDRARRRPCSRSSTLRSRPDAAAVREFQPDVVHVHMFEMHLSLVVVAATGRADRALGHYRWAPVSPTRLGVLRTPACTTSWSNWREEGGQRLPRASLQEIAQPGVHPGRVLDEAWRPCARHDEQGAASDQIRRLVSHLHQQEAAGSCWHPPLSLQSLNGHAWGCGEGEGTSTHF